MDRYFARLAVDKPVVRVNYGVQVLPPQPSGTSHDTDTTSGAVDDPDELAWAATTMGEEFPDETEQDAKPETSQDAPNADLRRHAQTAEVRPERLRLRVERQTLRRLPGTGENSVVLAAEPLIACPSRHHRLRHPHVPVLDLRYQG